MRLTLQKERETWRLSDLDAFHLSLLRQIAEDASISDSEEGRARLFPAPVQDRNHPDEAQFMEDWKEYVAGDLENQFAGDVGTVLADLDNIRPHRSTKEDAEPRHLLEVPLEHARSWFSALNQARILLDQKDQLHPDGGNEFHFMLPEDVAAEVDIKERLAVYMRYEFYAAIQEWLVQRAL